MRKCILFFMVALGVGVALDACATNPEKHVHHHHKRHHKHHHKHHRKFVPYHATGYASFYGHGDGFNGRKMANGKIFHANNPHLAAHPSLPLGTKLKVMSVKTHRVLYVEVTDRMGRVHGRIIDLSYGGAKYFGLPKYGIMKVKVKSVTDKEYRKHVR